ncbi:hypothetical protein ScPMuIL_015260 [Solemya velum]
MVNMLNKKMKSETKENHPPNTAKKSKIPVTRSSTTGKKLKSRPAPDFQRLHRKWQHDFEMGKACHKKPCTSANEFDLTKPGTKFHRPDGLADSDEDNELYFMSDIQALESIVSDRGLAHEKISGRLTTGKMRHTRRRLPFRHLDEPDQSPVGNPRMVLGDLSPNPKAARRTGLSYVPKQRPSVIQFEKDERALNSILHNTGVSSERKVAKQAFAGNSETRAVARSSLCYVPPKDRPSMSEAFEAYRNMVLSRMGINERDEEAGQLGQRGGLCSTASEKKINPSSTTIHSSVRVPPVKHEFVPSSQPIHVSNSESPNQQESSGLTSQFTRDNPDRPTSPKFSCEFGQSPSFMPQRNSVFDAHRPAMFLTPSVLGTKLMSPFTPTGSRFRAYYGTENSNIRDNTNMGKSVEKKNRTSQACSTPRVGQSASAVVEKSAGDAAGEDIALNSQTSSSMFVSPSKRKFVESSQSAVLSPKFKSPANVHSVHRIQRSSSNTPNPVFNRVLKKTPVSLGPKRVLSASKRDKKKLTWMALLESPDTDSVYPLIDQDKVATTLVFHAEDEVEAESVHTGADADGGFSIDGCVYPATDATRHNQRDESSPGQGGVSHRCLPLPAALTSSSSSTSVGSRPPTYLPLVTASSHGTVTYWNRPTWATRTQIGARRGQSYSTGQHACLDHYSSRRQELEVQERGLEEDISEIKMAMQTADSSNEQSSSSSENTAKSQKSASVSESKCSDRRHIASEEGTRSSVEDLNRSITESRSNIVQLEEEMEILQQAPVHDGNGNHSDSRDILQQLNMVHEQQQQLLQVQLQLQEQLKAQMVITQDISPAATVTNSNVCHTGIQEHNNNNVNISSCDNSSIVPNEQFHVQLNKMADFVINLPGADTDPVHRAGLEELGSLRMQSDQMACSSGQTFIKLDTVDTDKNLPCRESSSLDSWHNLQSEYAVSNLRDPSSTLTFSAESSSFTPVKSKHNTDLKLTPSEFVKSPSAKNNFSSEERGFSSNILVTPQPVKKQLTQDDGQVAVSAVFPPIWTPLALSVVAKQQNFFNEKKNSNEHDKIKFCSQLSNSALDKQNGNFASAITQCNDVQINQSHVEPPVDIYRETKSESLLDQSAVSLGSLSLRANTPEAKSEPQRRGTSQSLYRKALLKSTQRFHEALLDEECALYTCRLQNYLKSSLIDRGFTNPVAKVLTEGDDMHFVPIWEENLAFSVIQGSAFSCYSTA